MSQAAADLEAEFSSANVADWQRKIADESIHHVAVGVTTVPDFHWINRPTFQQVVQTRNVDHYRCYRAKRRSGFGAQFVTFTDRFGTRSATLTRPDTLCNAVDKNGEGIVDASAHLACYRLRQSAFGGATVTTANQFGAQTFGLTRARTLCIPSEVNGVASALGIDHFACYRAVNGTPLFVPQTVTVADQYAVGSTVVARPDTVCAPADKNGEGIRDPTAALTCYRTKAVRGQGLFAARNATVTNQFGTQNVTVRRPRTLCVPSEVTP
jgi:hypothetical protein